MSAIAVVNRKGGVGKTTTAVNLAHGLAIKLASNGGGRVLLVDMDPQGDSAVALGIQPEGRCISNVLSGQGKLKDNILPTSREGLVTRDNLFLIPSSDQLAKARTYLQAQALSAMILQQTMGVAQAAVQPNDALVHYLGPLKSVFDFIVVDCPPSLDDTLGRAVYKFVDTAVVPVKLDVLGTRATGKHTQTILEEQQDGVDIKIAAIVPTFVNARKKLTQEMAKALLSSYDRRTICKPIPQLVVVEEAPAKGMTLFEYAPESEPAQAYQYLVDKIYREVKRK